MPFLHRCSPSLFNSYMFNNANMHISVVDDNSRALLFQLLPGHPHKCDELIFDITSKVIMIEPSYWMEKKQNYIRMFPISMI